MNNPSPPLAGRAGTAPKPRPARLWYRLTIVAVLLALAGVGLVGFHRFKAHAIAHVLATIAATPPTVATAKVEMTDWQPGLTATGTLVANQGANLAAEVTGIVSEIHFKSGQEVTAGTLLLRLRPDDDDAKLAQLQATADLDETIYRRDLVQFRAQGVSQATVDTDFGNLKSARAQVAAQQAQMAEKLVYAPFSGKLGVRLVSLGQYLSAGTAIVSLQALDPIYVDFYLPQEELAQVGVGQNVTVHSTTYPGRDFAGSILALNSVADSSSRMVLVRATIANHDEALLPGTYATVDVAAGPPQPQVTIPQTAVTYNPFGSSVFKVVQDGTDQDGKPKLTVQQQFVTTGATRGDQIAILKGLSPGDVVVTSGQLKLQNNMTVLVNNAVQPSNDAAPMPTAEQ